MEVLISEKRFECPKFQTIKNNESLMFDLLYKEVGSCQTITLNRCIQWEVVLRDNLNISNP